MIFHPKVFRNEVPGFFEMVDGSPFVPQPQFPESTRIIGIRIETFYRVSGCAFRTIKIDEMIHYGMLAFVHHRPENLFCCLIFTKVFERQALPESVFGGSDMDLRGFFPMLLSFFLVARFFVGLGKEYIGIVV